MAHDHNEKIHTCQPCGYWHVANGRFQTWECPRCKSKLPTYPSRDWIIENIDPKFEGIPKNKTRCFNAEGFVSEPEKQMKRIVQSGADGGITHRKGVSYCPHCDHKPPNPYDWWDKNAETLVLHPAYWKSGNIAIITECPKCFEKSWVHVSMDHFEGVAEDTYPKEWIEAVEKLHLQVRLGALRDWAFGLCGRCAHLQEGKVEDNTWRKCITGFGPSVTECERFGLINRQKNHS